MEKRFELTDADGILERLKKVYNGSTGDYLAATLYSNIAKHGGKVFTPEKFVKTLINEFLKVFEGVPKKTIENALNEFIPKCIEALVDDKEFAEDALNILLNEQK